MDNKDNNEFQTELVKSLDGIHVEMAEIKTDLKHHVKRTDQLEAIVMPIRDSHQQMLGAIKLLGFVASCVALAAGLSEIVHFFH